LTEEFHLTPTVPAVLQDIQPLLLDVHKTVDDMDRHWGTVSYSKLNAYTHCQLGWFGGNFGTFLGSTDSSQEESAAVGGTIVQRIWTSLVNDRVYRELPSLDQRVYWMTKQHMALWYTIIFPYESQFEMTKKENRAFFKSARGIARLGQMTQDHGLDVRLYTGIQPKFVVNSDHTHRKHKTLEAYEDSIREQYGKMLTRFASLDVDFDKMISEVFFRTKFLSHIANGSIDFIYNSNGTAPFTRLSELKDGYVLLDGKLQIGPTVSTTQLDFYLAALFTQYRVMPGAVGFIDWSESDFLWHGGVSLDTVNQIQRSIGAMQSNAYILLQSLKDLDRRGVKTISFEDIPHLTVHPSRLNCRFCPMGTTCRAAHEAGTNRHLPKKEELQEGMK
jgi:hypothetical protein